MFENILREINVALFNKSECDSDSFTKWEIILFLLYTILSTRKTKIEVERLFIEQNCVGFVP